jgi:MSHA pilin protein MshC
MTRHVRGFTLTEMVIVLAIAGILAAVAMPLFRQPELEAGWFHEQARSTVRYAQRTAVAQRRCVFVSVAPPQLSLFYGDTSCAITALAVSDLASGQAVVIAAPAGVVLSAAPNPFRFNGLGQPSAAATITVGAKTIIVNAETGYVQ